MLSFGCGGKCGYFAMKCAAVSRDRGGSDCGDFPAPRNLVRYFRVDQLDQAAGPGLADISSDKYHARAPVVRWPAREPNRRVVDVLHAVDDGRALRFFDDIDKTLHAQQIGAAVFRERR